MMLFLRNAGLAACVVIFCASLHAQAPARVIGAVTSIDANGKKLGIKPDSGSISTVNVDDKTVYLRVAPGEKSLKNAAHIALTDIAEGDRVLAIGQTDQNALTAARVIVMSKTALAQKHEHDREDWQTRGIAGTITAIDPSDKTITIATRTAHGPEPIVVDASGKPEFRRYAPDSIKFEDAKPSDFDDLRIGDHLRALGKKSDDGTHYTAEEIVSGAFTTVAGTVKSTDAVAGTIEITDLHKDPVIVHVKHDTNLRKLPPEVAAALAHRSQGGPRGPGGPHPGTPEGAPHTAAPGEHPGAAGGTGSPDIQKILDHAPEFSLADLKPGEALIISGSKGADPGNLTAITVVAGVEPFLASAPRSRGEVNLGMWNLDVGAPTE